MTNLYILNDVDKERLLLSYLSFNNIKDDDDDDKQLIFNLIGTT